MRYKEGWEPEGYNLPDRLLRQRRLGVPLAIGGVALAATAAVTGLVLASRPTTPPPAAPPVPARLVSKQVPLTVGLEDVIVTDDNKPRLTITTEPFRLTMQLTDCTPEAATSINQADINQADSRTLSLLNQMIAADTGRIEDPETAGLTCDSVSTVMPDEVAVHSETLKAIAGWLPQTEETLSDLVTFQHAASGFADYTKELNLLGIKTLRIQFDSFTPPIQR